jgi:hypothetical protein
MSRTHDRLPLGSIENAFVSIIFHNYKGAKEGTEIAKMAKNRTVEQFAQNG